MKFVAINWTPSEVIGETKTDQMAKNADWLFYNTPRAVYSPSPSIIREQGVKILSGRVLIPKSDSDLANQTVNFGNFFALGCEPIITTSIVRNAHAKIFHVIHGIGQLHPDHRGFEVHINVAGTRAATDLIAKDFYVSWIAVGI